MTVWVGRYAMVGGEVREHGPWLVDRQRQHEESTLRLLVLAEPIDERSAEFCNEVAEAVAALFARDSLSITGGLLRALQQTHANLAEWNRRSLREHRVAVGVTCVVVRDQQVTIAQVGPGVVYLRDARRVTRLTTEEVAAATPLGSEQAIEPRFTATSLDDREILMLTSTAEAAAGIDTVGRAIEMGPERALAELFLETRSVSDMAAVLVADLDVSEEQLVAPMETSPGAWADDLEGREVASLVRDDEPEESPASEEPARPRIVERAPAPPPEPQSAPASEPRRGPPRRIGRASGPPLPRLRNAPRLGGRGMPRRSLLWAAAVIAALVALLLAAWLVVPGLVNEDRAEQLETALATAQAQMQVAEAATRADDQRLALQQGLVELERARSLAPNDPRIVNLETLAEARLTVLDAVTPVNDLVTLLVFEGTLTAPVTGARIVTGGRGVWLLESDRGRVIRIDATSGAAAELYRADETYDGESAGDPVAISWDASTGQLLVLDEAGLLFAMPDDANASDPTVVPLRDADELTSVTDMTVYSGNLYVLDADQNEVWRYLPAVQGFDSERTGILGNVDLEAPLAVAVDGDVFVQDGGTLRRFSQGQEQPPMLEGIDVPPVTPVGMVEDTLRGLFYVADRGERRVVVGDRAGDFVRQYRHPDFADLRGIAVSPDGARIYVLLADRVAWFSTSANANGANANGAGDPDTESTTEGDGEPEAEPESGETD